MRSLYTFIITQVDFLKGVLNVCKMYVNLSIFIHVYESGPN